jgi:uncharacterized protein
MPHVSLNIIQDFLAQKRIAIIGVSRNEKHFSRMLFNEFSRRGYVAVPVNPNAYQIAGSHCFSRVQEIKPVVDAALLLTPSPLMIGVLRDCAEAGIKRVWIYGLKGEAAVDPKALAFCNEHGMRVVPGECPFMFFPNNGFHALHGFVRKITGSYPRK